MAMRVRVCASSPYGLEMVEYPDPDELRLRIRHPDKQCRTKHVTIPKRLRTGSLVVATAAASSGGISRRAGGIGRRVTGAVIGGVIGHFERVL